MSGPRDLSRYNRAGLRHFRYVDGNAATYLEDLRELFADHFPHWADVQPLNEDEDSRYARALARYHGPRKDWAWEIARVFARACHVLTEHIDAYANEGFLETATQWDNVRRLVDMLGYHPAPPSSASTLLVLAAKPERHGPVAMGFQVKHTPPEGGPQVVFETLEELRVDARLNELRLLDWNRSAASFDPFAGPGSSSPWPVAAEPEVSAGELGVLVHEIGGAEVAFPVAISHVDRVHHLVTIEPKSTALDRKWKKRATRLLLLPKDVRRPRLNGDNVLQTTAPHQLSPTDVVAWKDGGRWHFDLVLATESQSLRLTSHAPASQTVLHKALIVQRLENSELRAPAKLSAAAYRIAGNGLATDMTFAPVSANGEIMYQLLENHAELGEIFIVAEGSSGAAEIAAVGQHDLRFDGDPGDLRSGQWLLGESNGVGGSSLHALQIERVERFEGGFRLGLNVQTSSAGVPEASLLRIALDDRAFRKVTAHEIAAGKVGDRSAADLQGIGPSYLRALWEFGDGKRFTIADVAALDPSVTVPGIGRELLREFKAKADAVLSLTPGTELAAPSVDEVGRAAMAPPGALANPSQPTLDQVFGPFDTTLLPKGYDKNELPIVGDTLQLALGPAGLPESLVEGRRVLVERATDSATEKIAHQATIKSINQNTIILTRGLDAAQGFTRHNTIVRANIVPIGHGEQRGEKVLGSGAATQLSQAFVLRVAQVSFVADSTMPSGVRADINLRVGAQRWRQVASLRDSRPADPHFIVRMTEDGFLKIIFGDGTNGRRLPSGANNVRVAYREGSGLSGNVAAGGLEKPVKPHKLIENVRQPIAATGGNDMEGVASLRESAGRSLLTLERAVSLSDFSSLAAAQASIWQARALRQPAALFRQQSVLVVLVPAGGGQVEQGVVILPDDFVTAQRRFLQAHALPGVVVSVVPYEPVLANLSIRIRVKPDNYDMGEVKRAVLHAVVNAFSLEQRKIGQPLHRGDLFQIVEAVEGVENSDCFLAVFPAPAGSQGTIVRSIPAREKQVVYVDANRSTIDVQPQEYVL